MKLLFDCFNKQDCKKSILSQLALISDFATRNMEAEKFVEILQMAEPRIQIISAKVNNNHLQISAKCNLCGKVFNNE